jgi:hypothetical protein
MAIGRVLMLAGVVLVLLGAFLTWGPRLPFRLGRLPGDIAYQGRNGSFYFPLTTCILLSVVLSLVMWLLRRLR